MITNLSSVTNQEKLPALPNGFIYLNQICPSIKQDLKYASEDNFTGTIVKGYNKNTAILTSEAATSLSRVQKELELKGKSLLIWDAYRPTRAVDFFLEWEHLPDEIHIKEKFYPNLTKEDLFNTGFIAPGHSTHSRGSTVDLTIIDSISGKELNMGTDFDFFGEETYTDNKNIPQEAQDNRKYFVNLMDKYGFENYPKEWWHFTLRNEPFPDTYFDFPIE